MAGAKWCGVLAVVLGCTSWSGGARAEVSYSRVDRATVRVFSLRGVEAAEVHTRAGRTFQLGVPETAHGSGVRVSRDGLILTAHHVVDGARFVAVQAPGERDVRPATVVLSDEKHDFAFIAVGGSSDDVLPLPERAPVLSVRQTVYAVGYPLDADRDRPRSNRGIVAGLLDDGSLQLDIAVNPGNSGGPVVDEREGLLGIVVARGDVKRGVAGVGVAVPLEQIVPAASRLREPGGPLATAREKLSRQGDGEHAVADLVAAMTRKDSVLGIVREATAALTGAPGAQGAARIESLVERALAATGRRDADVLALAAAYYWDRGAVASDLGKGEGATGYVRASELAQASRAADASVVKRSPFIRIACRAGK